MQSVDVLLRIAAGVEESKPYPAKCDECKCFEICEELDEDHRYWCNHESGVQYNLTGLSDVDFCRA